jgi:hypothetical protein
MNDENYGITEDLLEQFKIKKPKAYNPELKVIMDKNQALIRFPTIMTTEYKLTRNDKFILKIIQEKPLKLELERI